MSAKQIFISYARRDGRSLALKLQTDLQKTGYTIWLDTAEIDAGADWSERIEQAIDTSDTMLALLSTGSYHSEICRAEQSRARRKGKRLIPILVHEGAEAPLYLELSNYRDFSNPTAYSQMLETLQHDLENNPDTTPTKFTFQVKVNAPALPKHFIERPKELEDLRRKIISDNTDRRVALTALKGMGGIGKTILATALCWDETIKDAFPDGIYWVEIGREVSNLGEKIAALGQSMGDDRSFYSSEATATVRLRELLPTKSALIVLDDVWDETHVRPFLVNAPRCRVLLTTRSGKVASALEAEEMRLDILQTDQAIALLQELTGKASPLYRDIAKRLGNLPLALRLVGSQIREGITPAEWIETFDHTLSKVADVKSDLFAEKREDNLEVSIEMSIEMLPSAARPLYYALGIFPEDIAMPEVTVIKLWRQLNSKLRQNDGLQLLLSLERLGLITRQTEKVTLHDLLHDYTRDKIDPDYLSTQNALLAAHQPELGWEHLPVDEPYLWDYLAYHLIEADRQSELITTLLGLEYLAAKSLARPPYIVARDFQLAEKYSTDTRLGLLKRQFMNMIHLLQQCMTLAEIKAVLYSRLLHSPELNVEQIAFEHGYLRAYVPLPNLPHPALLRTLTGHTARILACAWSSDGHSLLSASQDRTLKVWDAHTGQERLTLTGHTDSVNACAWSHDGQSLLSASSDKTLKVWDTHTGQERLTLTGHTDSVNACAWSPDGQLILSASQDKTLRVWDAHTGQERLTLIGHSRSVSACAWSPDGQFILSASADNTLKMWDTHTGQERLTLTGHTDSVNACAWSPDKQSLLSTSSDNTLKVWNARTGQERLTLTGHADSVRACAWSPDGQSLLSAGDDHTLKVWNAHTGQMRLTLTGHTARVWACTWSHDGQSLLSASADNTLKMWETHLDQVNLTLTEHTASVNACAWSPDGQSLLTASQDRTLKVWDAHTGQVKLTLTGHTARVWACAWSPDGQFLLSAGDDHTLKMWDRHTGQVQLTLTGHTTWVSACAWSPDGESFLSGAADGTLKIWDRHTGQVQLTLTGHTAPVSACAWNPDGQSFLSASLDHTLKVWNHYTGQAKLTLTGHTARVWACAWSPDGEFLLSATEDKTLKMWDTHTGRAHLTLMGHTASVNACAWNPDGQSFLSASWDHTLKLWDRQTGNCLFTFPTGSPLYGCAWHPDGQRIAAVGAAGVYFLEVRL